MDPKAVYYQRGEVLDYPNNTDAVIEAGTIVVLAGRIGIAGSAIQPYTVGEVHVVGVFKFPKKTGEAVAMGAPVYYDGSVITAAAAATVAEANTEMVGPVLAGYAAADAVEDDDTILVKINA